MRIVVMDGGITNPGDLSWEAFEKCGDFICHDYTPGELALERMRDADAVLITDFTIDAQLIRACPKLRYIGVLGTGWNNVAADAAKERGVVVTNIPAYSTMAVAQHAMALLLEICNQVGYYNQTVQAGRWVESRETCYWDSERPLVELCDLTLGIIGYGSIGGAMAGMGLAMGMRVLANRNRRDIPPEDARVSYADLDEIYREADVISLHTPLLDSTRGMINAASLAKMKDGVILVNASRGGLVVEADLAAALAGGKVYAYGADVVAAEPMRADNPLLGAPNCFITPHIAWVPVATRKRLLAAGLDNLAAFIAGKPVNVVNS